MKSRIILSNVRFFRYFLTVRNAVLALFLVGSILVFTDFVAREYVEIYQISALAAFAATVLFEWLCRPVFLEIHQSPSGLRGLLTFNPENGFFRRFRAGEVQPLVIYPGDLLILHEEAGLIPLFDKVRFTLRRSGEPDISTKPIGIGWATPAQRAALRSIADQHYYRPRRNGGRTELPFSG